MPVTISFSDRSVADPAGNIHDYRDYVLTFDGLELLRDNIDRASVWIGIPPTMTSTILNQPKSVDLLRRRTSQRPAASAAPAA